MNITESLYPVFDENNQEMKQLYEDYSEKLQELYMKMYSISKKDMTNTAHDIHAVIEMVFQSTLPTMPLELHVRTRTAMNYLEKIVKLCMTDDTCSTILAVTKFIRHKQISMIASVGYTDKELMDSIPPALRAFIRKDNDSYNILKIARQQNDERIKYINYGVNRLIDLIHPHYPWDKLDTSMLLAGEYNLPKF